MLRMSETPINISSFLCSGLGLLVLIDIVHSYASADEMVGLSLFDGSNDCYFHSGNTTFFLLLKVLLVFTWNHANNRFGRR